MFTFHHCTLSVADLKRSIAFYGIFGFESVAQWEADDGSLEISHLVLDGFILELFCYPKNDGQSCRDYAVGNNLERIGVKHLALQVDSLRDAKEILAGFGSSAGTEIKRGRTGIDYFFVQDPDGLWLEIVEDHRPWRTGGISHDAAGTV
jgi:glyoxylase I family protein